MSWALRSFVPVSAAGGAGIGDHVGYVQGAVVVETCGGGGFRYASDGGDRPAQTSTGARRYEGGITRWGTTISGYAYVDRYETPPIEPLRPRRRPSLLRQMWRFWRTTKPGRSP